MNSTKTQKQGSEYSQKCHQTWQILHHPFILPRWAKHTHDWQTYDIGMAGCTLCGCQHICNNHACERIELEDGSSVCALTGMLISTLRFSDNEYTDCINNINTSPMGISITTQEDKNSFMNNLITQTLHDLLLSHTAEELLKKEKMKMLIKLNNTFTKCLRQQKTHNDINMVNIIAHTIQKTSNHRIPFITSETTRKDLCHVCTTNILRVFKLLKLNCCHLHWKRGLQRVKSLIVGLVYMTRVGIFWNDTVILAKIHIMWHILPHETTLNTLFGLRAKIITESENMIKMKIRQLSQEDIMQFAKDQQSII